MHLTAPEQGNLNRLIGDSSVTVNDENALMLIDRTIVHLRGELQRALAREKKSKALSLSVSGATLDGYVDDRGDNYQLTEGQFETLRLNIRATAKKMSITNQQDDSWVDTALKEQNERVSTDDDWVDQAIKDQNAQFSGAA